MLKNVQSADQLVDQGEPISRMEPLIFNEKSRFRVELGELVFQLTKESTSLISGLPAGIRTSLVGLTRIMNSYYSNLIEGHITHPIDIERALRKDFSGDDSQVGLLHEAKAHVEVEKWIDEGGLPAPPTSVDSLCGIHRRFLQAIPEQHRLMIADGYQHQQTTVSPGELRSHFVEVGRHVPISPGAVLRFLQRFESVYQYLGKGEMLLNAAAAHHRLLWIHPFGDGNGRVARLMSHTMILISLQTEGIWSITRGLARHESEYKALLANCDMPRRNDLDGRGNLSEEALYEFSRFFLEVCIDQVQFMEQILNPSTLRSRVLNWANMEMDAGSLPRRSDLVLKEALAVGSLPRSEIPKIVSTSERQSRRVTSALVERGFLESKNARAPFTLKIPVTVATRWLPGLFPEKTPGSN